MTHICVDKLTIIGSDNGLSPERRQAIIWTNPGILLIGPLGTNFNEISTEIHTFSCKKMHLKMSSAQWRLFRLGLNVSTRLLAASPRSEINSCLSFTRKPFNSRNNVILRYMERLTSMYIYVYIIFFKSPHLPEGQRSREVQLSQKWLGKEMNHPTQNCWRIGSQIPPIIDITVISQWSRCCLKSPASTVYSRHRSKEASKLCVTDLCEGNSPVTREIPTQNGQ